MGLVLELADSGEAVLERAGGEVGVEGLDDGVHLVALGLGEEGDEAALEGDDAVVLVSAAEVPVREGES